MRIASFWLLIGGCLLGAGSEVWAQSKFFTTSNRSGAAGAKQNAQIVDLYNHHENQDAEIDAVNAAADASITTVATATAAIEASFTSLSDCGDLGMLYGRGHAQADAGGCVQGLSIGPDGGIKIGSAITCNAGAEGTLRWNTASKSVEACDGADWVGLAAEGSGGGCDYYHTEIANAAINTYYDSNQPSINGLSSSVVAKVSGDLTATIIKNGSDTGLKSISVQNFDNIGIRVQSSSNYSRATNLALEIGPSYMTCWTVRTRDQDPTPDPFVFTNLVKQELSASVVSNVLTLVGFDGPVLASVSGSGAQVKVGTGSWGTSGNINPGDTIQLRVTTSASYETDTVVAYTVGASSGSWTVRTKSECATSGQKALSLGVGCSYANDICYFYPDIDSTVAISSNFVTPPNSSTHGSYMRRGNGCDNRGNGACGSIDKSPYFGWGTTNINGINWDGPSCTFSTPAPDAIPVWTYQQACPGPDLFQTAGQTPCYRLMD